MRPILRITCCNFSHATYHLKGGILSSYRIPCHELVQLVRPILRITCCNCSHPTYYLNEGILSSYRNPCHELVQLIT